MTAHKDILQEEAAISSWPCWSAPLLLSNSLNCAGVCCWRMIFTVRSLDECKNVSSAFSLKATCNDVTSKRTTNAVAFSRIHFNKIPTEAFPLSPARREPIFITRFTHIHILLNTFIFSLTSFIVQQAPRIEKLSPFRKLKAWAIHSRLEKKKNLQVLMSYVCALRDNHRAHSSPKQNLHTSKRNRFSWHAPISTKRFQRCDFSGCTFPIADRCYKSIQHTVQVRCRDIAHLHCWKCVFLPNHVAFCNSHDI